MQSVLTLTEATLARVRTDTQEMAHFAVVSVLRILLTFLLQCVHIIYCVLDVNECSDSAHDCSEYAQCMDTEGSYSCSCNTGYTGNGTMCTSKIMGHVINIITVLSFKSLKRIRIPNQKWPDYCQIGKVEKVVLRFRSLLNIPTNINLLSHLAKNLLKNSGS